MTRLNQCDRCFTNVSIFVTVPSPFVSLKYEMHESQTKNLLLLKWIRMMIDSHSIFVFLGEKKSTSLIAKRFGLNWQRQQMSCREKKATAKISVMAFELKPLKRFQTKEFREKVTAAGPLQS